MTMLSRLLCLCSVVLALTACGDDASSGGEYDAGGGTGGTGGGGGSGGSGDGGPGGADAAFAGGHPAPKPSGCIDDVSAGGHRYVCDGISYDVRVPAPCLDAPCGLIFDVHGFSMSAAMEEANTNLADLGEEHGYVVFQPNANPAPPAASWAPETDHERVFDVLEKAIDVWHIDPDRVHFTGFSQGGVMTWAMLCKHADVFASVAPAAAGGCKFEEGAMPSREVPVLYLHGTVDALVDFDSIAVPQRDAVVRGWKMGEGEKIAGDDGFERTRYTSPNGTVFEFLQHDYSAKAGPCVIITLGGHCFPGSDDPGGAVGQACSFACVGDNAFHWGEEVVQFFLDHPRVK